MCISGFLTQAKIISPCITVIYSLHICVTEQIHSKLYYNMKRKINCSDIEKHLEDSLNTQLIIALTLL